MVDVCSASIGGCSKAHFPPVTAFQVNNSNVKGGLISEGILTLVPLPKKGTKCYPRNRNFE